LKYIIPTALLIDRFQVCPFSRCDGFNLTFVFYQAVPGIYISLYDIFIGIEDTVVEKVAFQILPDIFPSG